MIGWRLLPFKSALWRLRQCFFSYVQARVGNWSCRAVVLRRRRVRRARVWENAKVNLRVDWRRHGNHLHNRARSVWIGLQWTRRRRYEEIIFTIVQEVRVDWFAVNTTTTLRNYLYTARIHLDWVVELLPGHIVSTILSTGWLKLDRWIKTSEIIPYPLCFN